MRNGCSTFCFVSICCTGQRYQLECPTCSRIPIFCKKLARGESSNVKSNEFPFICVWKPSVAETRYWRIYNSDGQLSGKTVLILWKIVNTTRLKLSPNLEKTIEFVPNSFFGVITVVS
jgi:hypothetical protein